MYREFKLSDGSINKLSYSSDDNYDIKLDKNYKLVSPNYKKGNKFNNSIFGSDIGIKSNGFSTIILLSLLLVIGSLLVMYFKFKI